MGRKRRCDIIQKSLKRAEGLSRSAPMAGLAGIRPSIQHFSMCLAFLG